MSPKERPPVTAAQSSAVAVVYLSYGRRSSSWVFYDRNYHSRSTSGFKSKDEAVSAAFKAGFGAVMFEGKIIARAR